MSIDQRFVLVDDDLWMYYLGDIRGQSTPLADNKPMTKLRDGWWAADREAAQITISTKLYPTIIGYKLTDPAAESPMFPAALTPDEYEARSEGEGFLSNLYDRVTEDRPDQIVPVNGPWIGLTAPLPPAGDERVWVPQLGPALRNRPEFHHLLPGYLDGFKEHVKRLAEAHPYREYVFLDYQKRQGVTVILQVPFDQPVTKFLPALNQNGSRSKTRPGTTIQLKARRELLLAVPDRIPGATRAEATAEWDRQTAHYQQILDDAQVGACSACRGHGYVPTGAEQYDRSAK